MAPTGGTLATVPAMALPKGARARAPEVVRLLAAEYPDVRCALDHRNAYELLTATILSAQTTDERVNMVTPHLFAEYPTPADLAHADPAAVEEIVKSTGFFRAKTKSIIGMASALEDRFDGEVPTELDDLVTVPGVGRKTGNVVRSVAFDLPGLPVDTHVTRLSRLLGLTRQTDPVKIERDLNSIVPPEEWGRLSLRLIEHGRKVCIARRPRCDACVLAGVCPSAFKAAPGAKPKAKPAKKANAAAKAKSAAKAVSTSKPQLAT
jgi:endonuclease-3